MANIVVQGIDQTSGVQRRITNTDAAVRSDGSSIVANLAGAANGLATLNGSSLVVQNPASAGLASGIATLNGSTLVVQNPASASTTPGSAIIPIADGNGRLADAFMPFASPRWKKFSKTYTDLSAAALTNDIEVYSLAAGEVIHGVKIKHSTAFSGGAIASYTASIGISGNLTKYASAFDVFQATSNTTFQLSNSFGSENHGAATSIRIAAVATGANLDQATQGSVDVWILVSGAV